MVGGVSCWGGGFKILGPHPWPPFMGLGRKQGTGAIPRQRAIPSDGTLPKVGVWAGGGGG